MRLTPNEVKLVIWSLRSTVAQFSGKEDWHPEDWEREKREQAATRRLLKKLEARRTAG